MTATERGKLWRKRVKAMGWTHYAAIAPPELVKLLKQTARQWKATHAEYYIKQG